MKALNQQLPKELTLPTNPQNIVEKFSCDSGNDDCMNSKCNVCETPEEIAKVLSSGEFQADNIIFNEWAKVDSRVQKLSTSIDVEEIPSRLNSYVKTLKRHIHVKRIQNQSFNNLKSNLKPNEDIYKWTIARITLIKTKAKSKVPTLDRGLFPYLRLAAMSTLMVPLSTKIPQ